MRGLPGLALAQKLAAAAGGRVLAARARRRAEAVLARLVRQAAQAVAAAAGLPQQHVLRVLERPVVCLRGRAAEGEGKTKAERGVDIGWVRRWVGGLKRKGSLRAARGSRRVCAVKPAADTLPAHGATECAYRCGHKVFSEGQRQCQRGNCQTTTDATIARSKGFGVVFLLCFPRCKDHVPHGGWYLVATIVDCIVGQPEPGP